MRIILAIATGLLLQSGAHAIECQPRAMDQSGHWSWRSIDGKRCWYRGRPGMSKNRLSWKPAEKPQPKPKPAIEVNLEVRAEALPENPRPTFEDRWPFKWRGIQLQ
jgi:hypothetical protein